MAEVRVTKIKFVLTVDGHERTVVYGKDANLKWLLKDADQPLNEFMQSLVIITVDGDYSDA